VAAITVEPADPLLVRGWARPPQRS